MRDLELFLSRAAPFTAPATVLVALVVGATSGIGPALLVLAFGVLIGAVLLLWSSLGRLTGESPLTLEEAMGFATPSLEEERKRSVLRALKDLEYERSVGKISEEDFAELSSRYRTEAKDLLRALEAELGPRRAAAEERLKRRLAKEGLEEGAPPKKKGKRGKKGAGKADPESAPAATEDAATAAVDAAAPAPDEDPADALPAAALERPRCPACETPNDPDALFCKRCGATLTAREATP